MPPEACFQKYSQAMPESVKEMIRYAEAHGLQLRAGHAARYYPYGVAACDIMGMEYYVERGDPALARQPAQALGCPAGEYL